MIFDVVMIRYTLGVFVFARNDVSYVSYTLELLTFKQYLALAVFVGVVPRILSIEVSPLRLLFGCDDNTTIAAYISRLLKYWHSLYVIIACLNVFYVIWNRVYVICILRAFTLILAIFCHVAVFFCYLFFSNREQKKWKWARGKTLEKHKKRKAAVKERMRKKTTQVGRISARKIATFTMTLTDAQKSLERARK